MTAEEMICRWAERKYGLTGVVAVEFEIGTHGPYSDVTPDVDPYMGVVCTLSDGRKVEREEGEYYTTALIREIVAFASPPTEGKPQ